MKNEPAFPGLHPSKECHYQDSGMRLRDYFAAKAMQGILFEGLDESETAKNAYAMADAMLKARQA
jgi:predicted RNA polymerase sigma factor